MAPAEPCARTPTSPFPRPPTDLCSAVQRRIKTLLPHARLVAVLRDPVERAHSNRAHLRGAGLEPEADFLYPLAVRKAGWAPRFAEDIVRVEPSPDGISPAGGPDRVQDADRSNESAEEAVHARCRRAVRAPTAPTRPRASARRDAPARRACGGPRPGRRLPPRGHRCRARGRAAHRDRAQAVRRSGPRALETIRSCRTRRATPRWRGVAMPSSKSRQQGRTCRRRHWRWARPRGARAGQHAAGDPDIGTPERGDCQPRRPAASTRGGGFGRKSHTGASRVPHLVYARTDGPSPGGHSWCGGAPRRDRKTTWGPSGSARAARRVGRRTPVADDHVEGRAPGGPAEASIRPWRSGSR